MKITIGLFALFTFSNCLGQSATANQPMATVQKDTSAPSVFSLIAILNPEDFNVYMIRKTGSTYSFYINGTQFYKMPFAPFYGNLIGFGAGRKISLAIDYLKVSYL